MSKCYAVQHSDQMVCKRCYQAWDVNDVCEPECDPAVCIDMSEEGGMKIKEWDGSGLPPIGTVCEYLKHAEYKTRWIKVRVVFIGVNLIVFEHGANGNEFSEYVTEVSFRPIKTPEQIAAEERLHAIDEMMDFLGCYSTTRDAMGVLYDAGYRRTEVKK